MSLQTSYKILSASGQVLATPGVIAGMVVSDITTALTVKLYDYLSATSTVILNTLTLAAGAYDLKQVECATGCYATLAGTGTITFLLKSRD